MSETKNIGFKNGLRELPSDDRDFSLAGVFDQIDISEVPKEDFIVAEPLKIKNQGETDFCSAYAVTSASEDQEGVELLPQYQFFKTKMLMGDPEEWGADLRTACKSAAKFGSLPVKGREYYLSVARSLVIDPISWPIELDEEAKEYKKETYFRVDGRYDTFDNIRCALWQHRSEKRSIVVGAIWKDEWTRSLCGIVDPKEYKGGFGHAFKIFGQKVMGGEVYLIAQLSNSEDIGDKGLFYFPREVVNREFTPFGQFMFKDMPRGTAEFYISHAVTTKTPWSERIKRFIEHISSKFKIK